MVTTGQRGRAAPWVALGVALAAGGAAVAIAWFPPIRGGQGREASGSAKAVAAPPDSRQPFQIVVGGETRGFIVPCGCASKQLGGLPRRGAFLAGLPAGRTLYLDAGGTPGRASTYDRIKAGFLWRGMEALGVAAANLGASEAAFGEEFLAAEAVRGGVPFLSTNVVRAADGKPAAAKERRIDLCGARVVVLGVCSPGISAGAGLRLREPAESLREPVARLRMGADLLVLLAHAPEEELIALAEAFPELDAVLGAGPGQPIAPRLVAGRTVLAAAGPKGKFLAVVGWAPRNGGRGWAFSEGRIVELSDAFPDHPAQAALVKEYQEALRRAAIAPEMTGLVAGLLAGLPAGYRFAGSEACVDCHAEDAAAWKATEHALGLETLKKKGFEADPDCVRCHTTGYGGPGGYRTLVETPAFGGIGCESCHGPAQGHTANTRARTTARARDACVTCHDPENSPTFNYEAYWTRIAHGKPASGGAGKNPR